MEKTQVYLPKEELDVLRDLIMTDRRLDLAKGEAEVALRLPEPGDAALIARKIADRSGPFMRAGPISSATAAHSG
jgi:hypothetical protein